MIEESHLNSYLRCMLIIQENDSSKIDEIKQRLSGNYQNKTEIISSLAETASSKGESGKLFLRALLDEMRLEKSENTVIILRSLIKLLQSLDKNWQLEVCVYIEQFAELQVSKSLACGVNEIEWFISTSWNAAVLEMSTNPNSVLASRYWISVVKLIGYLPNEALTYEKLKQAKTSLFCLINCNLDRIRKLRKLESVSKVDDNEDRMVMDFSNEHEIDAVIGETLLIIQKFREAFEKVKKYGSKEIEMPDPTLGYSVFKELELSLWSKDYESIPELIKYAASINAPLYVFERMVEIAITECAPGAITFTIVKPTLDLMLTVQEDFSIVKFAMWFRVLIESASVSNNLSDVVCDLFRQVLQVIESEPLYPQQEIHWLMTSAWNNGVQADSLSDSDLARIWIEIAVNLAGYDKSESSVASTIRSEYPKFLADLLG